MENIELPDLPFRDWEMDPSDIEYTLDAEGNREELGAGSYGSVRPLLYWMHKAAEEIALCVLIELGNCATVCGVVVIHALTMEYRVPDPGSSLSST